MAGSKGVNGLADYVTPYPGSMFKHAMDINHGLIYVFGGEGYDGSSTFSRRYTLWSNFRLPK